MMTESIPERLLYVQFTSCVYGVTRILNEINFSMKINSRKKNYGLEVMGVSV